jgi:chromosome segregation ATPase
MTLDDQVTELEDEIESLEAENFRLETEIERLERWKTDATYVINAWEEAWESAAVPDNLGATKSEAMLDEITRLRAEVKRLGVENDQCVRTLNQYMEAVQQMVTLLAEKDAKIERLRAAGDLLAEDLGDNPWADRLIAAWWEARRERP